MAQSQNLKSGTHFRHLAHIIETEIRDPDTPARNAGGKSLRFQPAECLAHRHMRGAEFGGDVILPQPFARRQLTANDAVGKRAADAGGNGIFRRIFCCLGHNIP